MESTAKRLKQIMEMKRLKQVDVLRLVEPYCRQYKIKLGKSDLSQFVNGKVSPGQSKLSILSMALGVSEGWLMGLDVPMNIKEEEPTPVSKEDEELNEYLDMLRSRPECRMLLKTMAGATKAEVEENVRIIETIRGYRK